MMPASKLAIVVIYRSWAKRKEISAIFRQS